MCTPALTDNKTGDKKKSFSHPLTLLEGCKKRNIELRIFNGLRLDAITRQPVKSGFRLLLLQPMTMVMMMMMMMMTTAMI